VDQREAAALDRYLTQGPPENDSFCSHEWGICPDSISEGFAGEPHLCIGFKGHHSEHVCGTCEAKLPLDDNEVSSLEEPYRD